jgi:hypothetical protein
MVVAPYKINELTPFDSLSVKNTFKKGEKQFLVLIFYINPFKVISSIFIILGSIHGSPFSFLAVILNAVKNLCLNNTLSCLSEERLLRRRISALKTYKRNKKRDSSQKALRMTW